MVMAMIVIKLKAIIVTMMINAILVMFIIITILLVKLTTSIQTNTTSIVYWFTRGKKDKAFCIHG